MTEQLEFKAQLSVDDTGTVTGTAWPFGSADRVGDVITKGAFGAVQSLPMLFAHDQAQAIGVWDHVEETNAGLTVKGRLLIDDVARAREVRALVREGAVRGLSIGFVTKKSLARQGGGRTISAVDLHEISIVAVPAHPGARIHTVKGIPVDPEETIEENAPAVELKAMNDNVTKLAGTLDKMTGRLDKMEAKLNRPAAGTWTNANDNAGPAVERKALATFARTDDLTELKAMSVTSNPDGGFLVLPTLESGIRQISRDVSPLRALASAVSIGTGSYDVIVDKGVVESGWVSETGDRPETSTSQLLKVSIPVYELYAAPRVTQTALYDASLDLGAFLEGKISASFAANESAAFASGSGTNSPRGFLTYDTDEAVDFERDWQLFQHVPVGSTTPTDAQFADALIELSLTLRLPYRGNATWLMSRSTAIKVRQLKDSVGHYVWQDSLQAGTPALLCGLPIAYDDQMPEATAGNLPIALADWRQAYQIVDRVGIRLVRDALTQKPYTIFYTYKRVGGDVIDFNALKFLKIAA